MTVIAARMLVEGAAEGPVTAWTVPLSFWGGLEVSTGRVVDRSHPACGEVISGRILVMPAGRGSSSSSSVLAEAIRCGTAPAALVLAAPDPIIAMGAIVARKLYGAACPVLVCRAEDLGAFATAGRARIEAAGDGTAAIHIDRTSG